MALMAHLNELRRRLVKAVLAVIVASIASFYFYEEILGFLTEPFSVVRREAAAEGREISLIFSEISSPFTFSVRISLYAGVVLSCPVWMYQLWAFLVPALERREKRYSIVFLGFAVPLFLGGIALAYSFLPTAIGLLIGFTPQDFENLPRADQYLSFVIRLLLVFGFAFLLPVLLVLLNVVGVVTGASLRGAWRGAVFGIFVFAAVASPTGDPLSLMFLALPMCLLFAITLVITAVLDRRKARADPLNDLDDDEVSPLDRGPGSGADGDTDSDTDSGTDGGDDGGVDGGVDGGGDGDGGGTPGAGAPEEPR